MQLSSLTLSLLAAAAAIALPANEALSYRQEVYAQLSGYNNTDCKGRGDAMNDTTKFRGGCVQMASPDQTGYDSVKVSGLGDGCLVYVFAGDACANGATRAFVGDCISGREWNSYRVDNCEP